MIMVPNHIISENFGKFIFIAFDACISLIIQKYLIFKKVSMSQIKFSLLLWCFNPLSINISSRGNADSIICFLVLIFLYNLQQNKIVLSGLLFGLSVHFKIYPIIYTPTVLLWLYHTSHSTKLFLKSSLIFSFSSFIIFCSLNLFFWKLYGNIFIEEAFLYHLTREDNRHNFSIHFYSIYLNQLNNTYELKYLCFIPQLLFQIIIILSKFKDIELCFSLQTLSFIMFNKVYTIQYFIWYLCILPLWFKKQYITKYLCFLIAFWGVSHGLWLFNAYQLEFKGKNTFFYLYCSCCLIFISNCFIIHFFYSLNIEKTYQLKNKSQ